MKKEELDQPLLTKIENDSNKINFIEINKKEDNKKRVEAVIQRNKVRLEPKTIFANERTYVKWMHVGITIISMGIFAYKFNHSLFNLFVTYCILGMLLLTYSLFNYLYRNERLKEGTILSKLGDRYAPIFLFLLVLISVIVLFVNAYSTSVNSLDYSSSYSLVYEQKYGFD